MTATRPDPDPSVDLRFMDEALAEATKAAEIGEVPVGAVVVRDGEIDGDPMAHAEILALRQATAATRDGWRLLGTTLYVTLEPCAMCAGALVNARVDTLVFATEDPKAGFCGSLADLVRDPRLNHRLTVREGVRREEASEMLRSFFRRLRS